MTKDKELDDIDLQKRRSRKSSSGKMGSSLSCVGVLWAMLSFAAMALSCIGFYLPFWLQGYMEGHNATQMFLSTFRRCNYPKLADGGKVVIVEECGRYTEFSDIPSLWWKVATISVGIGCGLTILVAFTAMLSCCLSDVLSRTSAKVAGVFQFIAGLGIGAGCLLYPLGWESAEVHQVCGPNARIYQLGHCTISWAYWATIAGGGTALLCALLSCSAAKDKPYRYYYHHS